MKIMTCRQLGGACEMEFRADSFDEIAQLSQQHGKEMHQKQDRDHLDAMQRMRGMMQDPKAMQTWMDAKRAEFDMLPDIQGNSD